MTKQAVPRTTVGEVMDGPWRAPIEIAAARATNRAGGLLHLALQASDLSQQQLASRLGVSPGRVSQVLSGDQNLYLTTLARYLRAMGYGLDLEAHPEEPNLPPIGRRRNRRRSTPKAEVSIYQGSGATTTGSAKTVMLIMHEGEAPKRIRPQGSYTLVGQVDPTNSRISLKDVRKSRRRLEEHIPAQIKERA